LGTAERQAVGAIFSRSKRKPRSKEAEWLHVQTEIGLLCFCNSVAGKLLGRKGPEGTG